MPVIRDHQETTGPANERYRADKGFILTICHLMDREIINFIQQQHIATVCCSDDQGNPFCFSCMYAFNEQEGLLYFKSEASAQHCLLLARRPTVAGTILPDKINMLAIKGLQFSGRVILTKETLPLQPGKEYHKKYPFALVMPGEVFTISFISIKMTDKSRGISRKVVWHRETADISGHNQLTDTQN